MQTNLYDEPLTVCSTSPMTGFFRDGTCRVSFDDHGSHSVCVVVTDEFLEFSKSRGNDLSTPIPIYGFEGLKAGDKWCLCALRWKEAYEANCAPKIDAKATSNQATKFIPKEILLKFSIN